MGETVGGAVKSRVGRRVGGASRSAKGSSNALLPPGWEEFKRTVSVAIVFAAECVICPNLWSATIYEGP